MKTKSFFVIILLLCSLSSFAVAQRFFAFPITPSGILTGKYNEHGNSIADTISSDEARSISMIDGLYFDTGTGPVKLNIKEFQLTIYSNDDSITVKGTSMFISSEMKKAMQKVKSGDKIYFEGILAEVPLPSVNMTAPSLISFVIR